MTQQRTFPENVSHPTSERDELASIIGSQFEHPANPNCHVCADSNRAAEEVLAAGFRKPRTIETTEGLIGLTNGALIMSTGRHEQFTGRVYRVKSAGMVERVGKELEGVTPFRYFVDPLPAIVIHEPEAR